MNKKGYILGSDKELLVAIYIRNHINKQKNKLQIKNCQNKLEKKK